MEEDMGVNMDAASPETLTDSNIASEGKTPAQEERLVPLSALQAERTQRQEMAEKLQAIENHLSLLSNQRQAPQRVEPEDTLQDDDVLTVGEAKKYLSKMDKNYQISIQEMKMQQKYGDYQQVINTYLPEVIKQKPSIAKTLEATQDFELAYYLAKNSDAYKKAHRQSKKHADAEAILANSQESGSLASVGRSAPLSIAKDYKNMSESEFRALAQRNLGLA